MVVEEEKATDDATRVVNSMHKAIHYGVLDIETQLSAQEVGVAPCIADAGQLCRALRFKVG